MLFRKSFQKKMGLSLLCISENYESCTEDNEHIYPTMKRRYTYKKNVSKILASFITFLQNLYPDLYISASVAES